MSTFLKIFITSLLMFGCIARPNLDQEMTRSALSDVQINVPKGKQLESFLGADCKEFKISPENLKRLGVSDHCDAATKLLDEFELTLKVESCEAGIQAESTTMVGALSAIKPKDKVTKGCTYSVLLKIGEIEGGKVYFSNQSTAASNLVVKKDAANLLSLKVKLLPTAEGTAIGFPGDAPIQTGDQSADLDIEVTFGAPKKSASPAPSAGGSPAPNAGSGASGSGGAAPNAGGSRLPTPPSGNASPDPTRSEAPAPGANRDVYPAPGPN